MTIRQKLIGLSGGTLIGLGVAMVGLWPFYWCIASVAAGIIAIEYLT